MALIVRLYEDEHAFHHSVMEHNEHGGRTIRLTFHESILFDSAREIQGEHAVFVHRQLVDLIKHLGSDVEEEVELVRPLMRDLHARKE